MKTIDYQRLFRVLPDSLLLLPPDGTVADNSDARVQVSLLPREQAVGRAIFVAYPPAPESQRELFEPHKYVRQHRVLPTMPWLRGPGHRYEFVSPAYQRVFSPRPLVGQAVADALPEVVAPGLVEIVNRVYATGERYHNPSLRIDLERKAGAPPQEAYVDLPLQQFAGHNQSAGILVFAVEGTDLTRAQAELAEPQAQGMASPGRAG